MSAGLVIFIFRSEPSTTCTSCPIRSTSPASSEAFTPSASARANASFKSFVANACGVCASTTRSRGTVPVIRATSSGKLARFTSLTVSIAGMPRIAASQRRASSITRATCSGVTNGRTASCTSTISVSFATSRSAAATESCLESPPFTTRTVCANFSFLIRSSSRPTSSARVATMMSVTCAQAAIRRKLRITIGVPSSSRNCLGVSAPMRVPIPAAGSMAAIRLMFKSIPPGRFKARTRKLQSVPQGTRGVKSAALARDPAWLATPAWGHFTALFYEAALAVIRFRKDGTCLTVQRGLLRKARGCLHATRGGRRTHAPAIPIAAARCCRLSQHRRRLFHALFHAAKNHLARRRLMHGSHNHVHTLVNHPPPAIHHDHRAVIQIRHALVLFLAFAKNQNTHLLPGHHGGLQRLRELIDVQHREALHRRDFVQVEVIGNDLCSRAPRQLHQFVIHIPGLRKIFLQNPHFHLGHFLNLLQPFESAPSALPLQRVRRIGHHLQFVQHKLRHAENSFHELRVAYIRDAPVDQYAGVQKLHAFRRCRFLLEQIIQRVHIQLLAPSCPQHQSEVTESKQRGKLEERLAGFRLIRAGDQQSHEQGGKDAQHRAKRRAYQRAQRHAAQPQL